MLKITNEHVDIVNTLRDICYNSSLQAGWYDKPIDNGTRFALMHSEISEAMEGDRKDLMDDHLPNRKSVGVELADCIIRIMDFCGRNDIDIGNCIREKFAYNQVRLDHKRENRELPGGKKY